MGDDFALTEPPRREDSPLTKLCKQREAFETPAWAARAILRVELMTRYVIDPCCGLGALTEAARDLRHRVGTIDVEDWSQCFDGVRGPMLLMDWLAFARADFEEFHLLLDMSKDDDFTVFMNPPFSNACDFVDQALRLGARKVLCFQTAQWRTSKERRAWFERNPPARVWTCGERATCWRFDDPRRVGGGSDTPTEHRWYVWERGHRGIEANHMLWKDMADADQGVML